MWFFVLPLHTGLLNPPLLSFSGQAIQSMLQKSAERSAWLFVNRATVQCAWQHHSEFKMYLLKDPEHMFPDNYRHLRALADCGSPNQLYECFKIGDTGFWGNDIATLVIHINRRPAHQTKIAKRWNLCHIRNQLSPFPLLPQLQFYSSGRQGMTW